VSALYEQLCLENIAYEYLAYIVSCLAFDGFCNMYRI